MRLTQRGRFVVTMLTTLAIGFLIWLPAGWWCGGIERCMGK